MAFNWQTFKTRTLTAAVFVVVMLTGLLWNQWSFFILFSIIHFGCWWEYLRLTEKIYGTTISKFSKFLIMDIGYVLFWLIGFKDHETPGLKIAPTAITIAEALIILILAGIIVFFFLNKKIASKAKWMFLGGLIYISLSLGLMLDLSSARIYDFEDPDHEFLWEYLRIIPCLIIFSLWINDTMAYIIGSIIGKTPLSKISPKKTWEGTMGGVILCILIVGFCFQYLFNNTYIKQHHIEKFHWFIISAIASIAGTFGDLLESKFKRMANVKDSGTLMPGHGGFLDRFDSMLLAIPAVWVYVYFFMS